MSSIGRFRKTKQDESLERAMNRRLRELRSLLCATFDKHWETKKPEYLRACYRLQIEILEVREKLEEYGYEDFKEDALDF